MQAYSHEGGCPLRHTDQRLNIERNARAGAGYAFFGTASTNSGVGKVESMCVKRGVNIMQKWHNRE